MYPISRWKLRQGLAAPVEEFHKYIAFFRLLNTNRRLDKAVCLVQSPVTCSQYLYCFLICFAIKYSISIYKLSYKSMIFLR